MNKRTAQLRAILKAKFGVNNFDGCISEVAQTALAYREMLKKIQFSATQVYDNDHIEEDCCPICGGQRYHEVDCELAKLLESEGEEG